MIFLWGLTFVINENKSNNLDMHHLISCSLRLSGDCSEGGKAYYAYVAEGVSKQQDWEEVMK